MTTAVATDATVLVITKRAAYCISCGRPTGNEYNPHEGIEVVDALCPQCVDLPMLWDGAGGTTPEQTHRLLPQFLGRLDRIERLARETGNELCYGGDTTAQERMEQMIQAVRKKQGVTTTPAPHDRAQWRAQWMAAPTPPTPPTPPQDEPEQDEAYACPNCGGTRFERDRQVYGTVYGTGRYVGTTEPGDGDIVYMMDDGDVEWDMGYIEEIDGEPTNTITCGACGADQPDLQFEWA